MTVDEDDEESDDFFDWDEEGYSTENDTERQNRAFLTQASESDLISMVANSPLEERIPAIPYLGKFQTRTVVETLTNLLKDGQMHIRAAALDALIEIGRKGIDNAKYVEVTPIIKLKNDKHRFVRAKVATALSFFEDDRTTGVLEDMLNDDEKHVRIHAENAIERFQDLYPDTYANSK